MTEKAIIVKNLTKEFVLPHKKKTSLKQVFVNIGHKGRVDRRKVLNNISFEINKGEFFGIVGRNGSGKSTLLKLLAGVYTPTKGDIGVNGNLTPFIELGVGFNPELTGRENVYLNGSLLGFTHKQMKSMYDDIVEFAELSDFMDQKLKNYSSGMQVRLAFSIAIRAKSDILLIDEVLAVGDAAFQKKCFDYFREIKKEKRTVIIVTHDMFVVRQYCDSAIMIEKGRIVESGTANKIATAYQKLLSGDTETGTKGSLSNRWGTGKLICKNVKLAIDKNLINMTTQFLAYERVANPVLGFTIYGPTGNNILEGNTWRKRFSIDVIDENDVYEIKWRIPNIFASGTYSVSIACCDESRTEFYDWVDEATIFSITREGNTAGMVDPELDVEGRILDEQ